MKEALRLAKEALDEGEFPVGAVLVAGDEVVGRGRRRNSGHMAGGELDHAEMVALRDWGQRHGDCAPPGDLCLYSTLEPCLMCLGAALLAGVKRIVFAYEDIMGGACGLDAWAVRSHAGAGSGSFYSGADVVGGVLRDESLALFRRFFQGGSSYWRDSLLCKYTLRCE